MEPTKEASKRKPWVNWVLFLSTLVLVVVVLIIASSPTDLVSSFFKNCAILQLLIKFNFFCFLGVCSRSFNDEQYYAKSCCIQQQYFTT